MHVEASLSGMDYVFLILFTEGKSKEKVHPYTGTEALYRPYGPQGGVEV